MDSFAVAHAAFATRANPFFRGHWRRFSRASGPVKAGICCGKCGSARFDGTKPGSLWAESGAVWFAGDSARRRTEGVDDGRLGVEAGFVLLAMLIGDDCIAHCPARRRRRSAVARLRGRRDGFARRQCMRIPGQRSRKDSVTRSGRAGAVAIPGGHDR